MELHSNDEPGADIAEIPEYKQPFKYKLHENSTNSTFLPTPKVNLVNVEKH